MKKTLQFLFVLMFAVFVSGNVFADSGTATFTGSGQDDDPTVVTVTPSDLTSVTGGGTIDSIRLVNTSGSIGGTFCGSWYDFDLLINGSTVVFNGCSSDLDNYLVPNNFTSLAISSNDLDNYSDGVTITFDLLVYYTPSSCPPPSNQIVTGITTTGAQLNWTTGGSSNYNVEYGLAGFTSGTGTMVAVTDTFKVLTGLTAGTAYDWYVQDSCSATDVSFWTGPNTFITSFGPHAYPLTEGFESGFTNFNNALGNNEDFTIDTSIVHSGINSVHNAYSNNNSNVLFETGILDLSTSSYPSLSFWHIAKTEGNYDKCYVEISTDAGNTYTALDDSLYMGASTNYAVKGYFHEYSYSEWGTGSQTPDNTWWKKEKFNLSPFKQDSVRFRFRLTSDGSVTRDGWYIDDIAVKEIPVNEIEVSQILGSYGEIGQGTYTVKAVVKNNGAAVQTSIPLNYLLEGGSVVSETMGSLAALTTDTFTFTTTLQSAASADTLNLAVYSTLTGDEDTSNDTAFTDVVTLALPYEDGFESYASNAIPDYWNVINATTSSYSYIKAYNYTYYANSGSKSLHFYNSSSTSGDLIAVLPKANYNINTVRLTFWLRGEASDFIIGVMTDPNDASTFVGYDTLVLPPASYNFYSVYFDNYTGTGKYIALKHGLNTTYDDFYLDDIKLMVPFTNDVEVSQILGTFGGLTATANDTLSVIVKNNGVNSQTNFPVKYQLDNGTVVSETYTGTIAQFSTDTFTFATTFDATAGGSHILTAYTDLANDEDNSNDTSSVSFNTNAQNDVGVTTLVSPINNMCGDSNAVVDVIIENYGYLAQNNVTVTAEITTPTGLVTLTGVSGSVASTAFDTVSLGTLNTTSYGVYNVVSYTTLAGDTVFLDNDTLTASFEIYAPLPVDYVDDFEASPSLWEGNGMYISSSHGKTGKGLYKYFSSSNNTGDAHLGRKIGPITTGSDLVFDYQIVNWSGGGATTLEADSFFFMVSSDCGNTIDTLFVVDSNSHVPTTDWIHKQIDLTSYVGDNIIIAFAGQHNGSGDYYFSIDNFGVATPPTVDLGADTTICVGSPLTIDAGAGVGYSYLWTVNGDTIAAATSSIMTDSAATFTVEIAAPAGMAYDTIVVSANALPVVSFTGLNASYCTNDMASTLVGTPANGTFSGNGVSGSMFDPSLSSVGVQVINYSYTDLNGCTNDMNDTTMVYEAPMAMMSMDTTICEGESVEIAAGMPQTPSLIFSMYIEGSSNNKAIEIFNSTMDTLDLDNYRIAQATNGGGWQYYHTFPAGTMLAPHTTWVMVTDQTSSTYYDTANADEVLSYPSVVHHNGDDARAIEVTTDGGTTWTMVDLIGDPNNDPGSGWDVAGVSEATANHTLIRKSNIVGGSTDWAAIAGTDSLNSQYLVYGQNEEFNKLGTHTVMSNIPVAPSYMWSNGETTPMITVMPTTTTTYTVTVSNANCSDIGSVTVTVNPLPMVNLGADTTIKWSWALTLDAGNPNAMWTWSTGATTQTETFDNTNLTNSADNTVYVDVVENGCAASDTIVITVLDDVSINGSMNDVSMNIYPNPNNGKYTMTIDGINGAINMEVIDVTGQVVYREKLEATANYSAQFDMSTLATGVYYIKLTNNDGVKTQKLIIK